MAEYVKHTRGSVAGKSKKPYDAMVYKDADSGYTIAVDGNGNVIKKVLSSANTDDVVIRAAINLLTSGGVVFVDEGTYYLSSDIYLKSNMTFKGAGMYLTAFRSNTTTIRAIFAINVSNVCFEDYKCEYYVRPVYVYASTTSISNFIVRNIYLTQNRDHGFRFIAANSSREISDIILDNCIAEDTAWGFLFHCDTYTPPFGTIRNVTLYNCKAINCGRYYPYRYCTYDVGFSLEIPNTYNVTFINCSAEGCLESGFHQEVAPYRENVRYIGCVSRDNAQKTKESNTIVYREDLNKATPFVCTTITTTHAEVNKLRVRIISELDTITNFSVRIQGLTPGDVPIDETITEATPGVVNETNGWSFYTSATFKTFSDVTVTVNSVTGASSGDYINVGQDATYGYGMFCKDSILIGCTMIDELKPIYSGYKICNDCTTIDTTSGTYTPYGKTYVSNLGIGVDPSYLLHIKGTASTDLPTYSAEFLDGDNWTGVGTDWTGSWAAGFTHVVGNTTVLSHDHAAVNGTKYQIAYTVTGRTAGTFTITFGGRTSDAISATGSWGPVTTSTGYLQITPTSDFNGTIVISIKSVINVSTPVQVITDSSGNILCEIRGNNIASNTIIGRNAGRTNTTGGSNSFFGTSAGYTNSTGYYNSFFGMQAGFANSTGYANSFFGLNAGVSNSTGYNNSFFGASAGYTNNAGYHNSFIGFEAGFTNSTGNFNSFFGGVSGYTNSTGNENSFFGTTAGSMSSTGSYNSFFGRSAGRTNTTGSSNSFFGYQAGYNANQLETAQNSMGLGTGSFTTRNNQVVIGDHNITETQLRAKIYVGSTSSTSHTQPTAKIHIAAGSASAGTAPLKFTSGTLNTSPEAGAIEFDGTDYYVSI